MANVLAIIKTNNSDILVPFDAIKDQKSQLNKFSLWLDENNKSWTEPCLSDYRDHLLNTGLSTASTKAHLCTIRGRYADLLRNNAMRDLFASEVPSGVSPVERKAFVDEKITRLQNDVDPKAARVKTTQKQDIADSEHIRLTKKQASALRKSPGVDTLLGIRDTAIIAMLLCTGIREEELVSLEVADLRQRLDGCLALKIRDGKGSKQRLIPYGELDWVLTFVDAWLNAAGITEGAVFRGFRKGSKQIRPSRLTSRAIQDVLKSYPVVVDGKPTIIRPHDCRRTYARRLYDTGMPLLEISQNLGHANIRTTQLYVGSLSAEQREPTDIYDFDLADLPKILA